MVVPFFIKYMKTTKVQLHFNDYVGRFYRQDKNGHWYKFHQIGNTGVAFDVADMLMKMGIDVEFISESTNENI